MEFKLNSLFVEMGRPRFVGAAFICANIIGIGHPHRETGMVLRTGTAGHLFGL